MSNNKNKKVEVDKEPMTVRKYFYAKGQFDKEYYLKALERTYKSDKKTQTEWDKIMKFKNINF